MKWIISVVVTIILAVGAGYQFRDDIALMAISYMAKKRLPVGPHQPIQWSSGRSDQSPSERPPNIILIVADDLGWNDLSFNGGGVASGSVPTPNINTIADEGISFSNGYAAYSSCAPSRAALMSGRYPTRFGFAFTPTPPGMQKTLASLSGDSPENTPPIITYFDQTQGQEIPYENMGLPGSEVTLAETLKTAGYHTAHIGKWHLGLENGMSPLSQGFDESLLMASGLYLPEDDPNVINSKQDFDPIDRFLWSGMRFAASFGEGPAFKPGGYLTDYYTEEAVKVIENNRDRPFFLYLAHWAPHTPLQATRADYEALSHIKLHRERVYAAMIRALDRGVGQVMQALKDNGIDDNTLVIFTSDNGGAGYIGINDVNKPYRGWKLNLFEGGIHVPYFMRWPEKISPGRQNTSPVHHFDIYTTAAGAAGATLPGGTTLDGVDLLPYTRANTPATPPHESLFWLNGHYQVMLSKGWKLQKAKRPDKLWLFDLNNDPTEQTNLADQYPGRVAKMLKQLAAHEAAQPAPAWPAQLESPQRIDKHGAQPWDVDDEYVYMTN
ncbi:MAG: sulfatase-like hydrolase/transferase [Halieaceae bacterium]|jgi:arylsulfatase A-like enzyme|nr:sulfatase-like hydrolase/transferase [Halieaceae bacterium]